MRSVVGRFTDEEYLTLLNAYQKRRAKQYKREGVVRTITDKLALLTDEEFRRITGFILDSIDNMVLTVEEAEEGGDSDE